MSLKGSFRESRVAGKIKQIKRPTKTKSYVRKDTSKRTAFFIWSLILGMLSTSILAFLLSFNTRSVLNETNRIVEAREEGEVIDEIPKESANEFLSNFIREYINVPNEMEALQDRANNLKEYMAFNDEFNNDDNPLYNLEGVNGTRRLESFNLFNVDDGGNTNLYQYKVTFTNILETEVEKEVKKGKKTETIMEIETEEEAKTLLLNLSIVHEDGLFSISAVPYFTAVPSLAGTIEYEDEAVTLEEYNGNKKEDIEQFLNNFFEKFSSEPLNEMGYLMKEPQTINGSFLFDEINNLKIYVDGDNYKVLMGVMFRDELTDIQQYNPVEMTISKNGTNYYVEKFNYK